MDLTRTLTVVFVVGMIASADVAVAANEPVRPPTPTPAFSVTIAGSGDRPMVLIPGLMSSGDVWKDVVEHYSSDYRLHVLTLAGFAGVPPVEGPLLERVRDDLIAYIRTHSLYRPILVGHSLGAVIAFWVASVAPESVGEIVAIDGVPFASALIDANAVAEEMTTAAEMTRALYRSMTPEQLERQSAIALRTMISDPAHVTLATEWAKRSSPATTGQAVYEVMTIDLRRIVSSITSDVLLVAATKAFASNAGRLETVRKAYEDQVALVPRHRVIAASRALHFVMLDDPEFLLASMDEFLDVGRAR